MVLASLYIDKVRKEAVERRNREIRASIADMRRQGMSPEEIIDRLNDQTSNGNDDHKS